MAESIRAKIEKALFSENVIEGFNALHHSGELAEILPELDAMITQNFQQFDEEHASEHHHLDLYHHTLEAVQNTDKSQPNLRWAALFHDFGKMANDKDGNPIRQEKTDKDTGAKKYTFLGHDKQSVGIAEGIMGKLGFEEKETDLIKKLVGMHERSVKDLINKENKNYEKNMNKFLTELDPENLEALIAIKTADINAQKPETRDEKLSELKTFRECVKEVQAKAKQAENAPKGPTLPVTNGDIIKFIPPGPGIKEAMSYLSSIYKEGMSREELLTAAKQQLVSIAQKYPAKQQQQQKQPKQQGKENDEKRGVVKINNLPSEKVEQR